MAETGNTQAAQMEELKKYEFVQFILPDAYGRPKGKIFSGRFKERAAKDGFDMVNAICVCFCHDHQYAHSVFDITGWNWPPHHLRPCLETLTPWPWVGNDTRRHANVLCDFLFPDGTPDLTSPRQLLKTQLDFLRTRHGLIIKTAFEYEFMLYDQATHKPRADHPMLYADMHLWNRHEALFSELKDVLEAMGVEVSNWIPEAYPGQWELTTEPLPGVRGADAAFYIKTAIKSFFPTRGYYATFMGKTELGGNGLHLNHSLWRTCENGQGEESVMSDTQNQHNMSPTARHWLAGVLAHAPALCALMCPTINCYRRLFQLETPNEASWGVHDKTTMIRQVNACGNVFLEHRVPSGAANPYLAIAALVAAGVDGLDRKLELQLPADSGRRGKGGPLPRSLKEALVALEEDQPLRELFGDWFVQCYVRMKRDGEIKAFEKAELKSAEEELEFEKKIFIEFI